MRALPRRSAHRVVFCLVLATALSACSPTGRSAGPAVNGTSAPSPTAAAPSPSADPAGRAAAVVARLSDADLVGQVLMPSVSLSDPAGASADLITKYRLGGVILMGNVENTTAGGTAEQVRELTERLRTAAATVPAGKDVNLLIGTDQEYGWVTRIKSGVVQLPSAMAFGAAARPDLTEAAWRGAGSELAAVGIDVDFAPTGDVLGSAANTVIGSRSYGGDPTAVAEQVAAAVRGLQSAGVAATVKHFPGHGHTAVNSHEALPVLEQSRSSLAASDLPPFQAGIEAGSWLVMTGHLAVRSIDAAVPATFSRKILVDLLREQMGFTGVAVTDALNMKPAMRWPAGEAAVRALNAGNDLLLMPPDVDAAHDGLLAALKSGQLPRSRLVEAATRVLTLKYRLAGFERPEVSTVRAKENRDAALAAATAAITVLKGPCSAPLASGPVRVTGSAGRSQQVGWLADALKKRGVDVVRSGGTVIHLVGYGDGRGDLAEGAAVTVAMDTPYLLRSAASPVRVATYSSTQVAMEALAEVVTGRASAPGRSPVPVTGLPRSACDS